MIVLLINQGGGGAPIVPAIPGLVIVAELVLTLGAPPVLLLELDTITP